MTAAPALVEAGVARHPAGWLPADRIAAEAAALRDMTDAARRLIPEITAHLMTGNDHDQWQHHAPALWDRAGVQPDSTAALLLLERAWRLGANQHHAGRRVSPVGSGSSPCAGKPPLSPPNQPHPDTGSACPFAATRCRGTSGRLPDGRRRDASRSASPHAPLSCSPS